MTGKFKKIFFLGTMAAINFGAALSVSASCDNNSGGGLTNPLNACSFADLVTNIAKIFAQIGTVVAVIFIIWSGFLFVTARGDETQLKKAKTTFYWTIIGTALVLGAWGLSEAIGGFIKTL